ncbi:MAG TPA: bifunctional [glutamate--ammonia ligase]-adenylyl-L-tyrosine phosphorylase/[glutamate--ammonia-ligase] adenylyltransferase, partial [Deltaproteobacteria bacterium]|nr:bifunctional [glutamate--ammonia ligase]-adenylyl-L-tyrosine phosphorylase/[glutamate--ammonia-ligase] adenylyltransferase [Deltaproteobacteria bacterium]
MKHYPDLEAEILELRRFKKERHAAIQSAFFSGQQDLSETMAELTHTAEAILLKAWRLAKEELSHLYGPPGCRARDGSYLPSRFAVVGMGKFGGRELHFGSDLDLIFIYSCNGETQGPRSVTNKEYFAKLAQRIISYLTMTTPLGYAYKIDTELRPSG